MNDFNAELKKKREKIELSKFDGNEIEKLFVLQLK